MAQIGDELRDIDAINELLANKLAKVSSDASGWTTLYQHRVTGQFWELTYPQSEMHGGGPRLLRCLGADAANYGGSNG
jgi:hypothetical protein